MVRYDEQELVCGENHSVFISHNWTREKHEGCQDSYCKLGFMARAHPSGVQPSVSLCSSLCSNWRAGDRRCCRTECINWFFSWRKGYFCEGQTDKKCFYSLNCWSENLLWNEIMWCSVRLAFWKKLLSIHQVPGCKCHFIHKMKCIPSVMVMAKLTDAWTHCLWRRTLCWLEVYDFPRQQSNNSKHCFLCQPIPPKKAVWCTSHFSSRLALLVWLAS